MTVIPKRAIKGIGMGHSAVVHTRGGLVLSVPRPGQMPEWKNVPLKDMLEKEFHVPSLLEHSVRTIAIAEKHFGLGVNLDDFMYIDAGMGIGAGIVIDRELYRGSGGSAGEFGHVTVDEHGPLCCCGGNGCLEAMASGGTIIQAVRDAIEKGVDFKVRELAEGQVGPNQPGVYRPGGSTEQRIGLSHSRRSDRAYRRSFGRCR